MKQPDSANPRHYFFIGGQVKPLKYNVLSWCYFIGIIELNWIQIFLFKLESAFITKKRYNITMLQQTQSLFGSGSITCKPWTNMHWLSRGRLTWPLLIYTYLPCFECNLEMTFSTHTIKTKGKTSPAPMMPPVYCWLPSQSFFLSKERGKH